MISVTKYKKAISPETDEPARGIREPAERESVITTVGT
jgi:hypothetical protein